MPGVRESYCGNLLTGDELTTMTDEQIQEKLSKPQGSNVSNDQVAPKRLYSPMNLPEL